MQRSASDYQSQIYIKLMSESKTRIFLIRYRYLIIIWAVSNDLKCGQSYWNERKLNICTLKEREREREREHPASLLSTTSRLQNTDTVTTFWNHLYALMKTIANINVMTHLKWHLGQVINQSLHSPCFVKHEQCSIQVIYEWSRHESQIFVLFPMCG